MFCRHHTPSTSTLIADFQPTHSDLDQPRRQTTNVDHQYTGEDIGQPIFCAMSTSAGHANGGGHDGEDEFVHEIAVEVGVKTNAGSREREALTRQMARVMNNPSPNDLLAKRIIDIARGNRSGEAFLRGE
jgi:pre-mRNA-splicing factor ATP-dependent RNA helicase DHX38/PRP16